MPLDVGLPEITVSLPEIERQQRHEASGVEQGVARYRQSIAEAELPDTPPGVLAMREMMGSLIPAIRDAQREAQAGITAQQRGANPQWWWLISYLSAEKLALITARVVMNNAGAFQQVGGRRFTAVAIGIGNHVKTEMEFDNWRRTSKAAASKDVPDMYRILTSMVPVVNTRTFKRWRKKLRSIEREEWSSEMKTSIGAHLLILAAKHGGGWFEIRSVWDGGRRVRRVFLSEAAGAAIADVNSRLEVQRPLLTPMLCPPKRWRKV